jgi:hypothetical protein
VWQYPGAKPIGELKGGSVAGGKNGEKQPLALATSLYSSTTADSIEKVWGHYAKLAGIKTAFAPGAISGGSDSAASVGSEHATGTFEGVAYYTGDAARVSARTATIAAQNPDFTATVFLVQVQGESRTDITLVVGENP